MRLWVLLPRVIAAMLVALTISPYTPPGFSIDLTSPSLSHRSTVDNHAAARAAAVALPVLARVNLPHRGHVRARLPRFARVASQAGAPGPESGGVSTPCATIAGSFGLSSALSPSVLRI